MAKIVAALVWGIPEKRLVIRLIIVSGSVAYSFVRFSSCPYNGFQLLTSLAR
jgi:hypothetical protein